MPRFRDHRRLVIPVVWMPVLVALLGADQTRGTAPDGRLAGVVVEHGTRTTSAGRFDVPGTVTNVALTARPTRSVASRVQRDGVRAPASMPPS